MFLKEFEIRWSDLDANRHLANISYITYAGEVRMAFLQSLGLTHQRLTSLGIGPVVFDEHLFYFKEALPDQKISVSTVLAGMSKNGTFFEFEHNFYDQEGQNMARCEMMGAWMNLKTRKLRALPEELITQFEDSNKTKDYKVISASDTRKHGKKPIDLK